MNFRLVSRFLGLLALLVSASMAVCIPWAIVDGDLDSLLSLVASMAIGCTIGVALFLLGRRVRFDQLQHREGLLVVAAGWTLAGLLGALPFILARSIPNAVDAWFESVSGFTTTGASILTDIEQLPRAILFWRSLMQWLGGMGIVVLFVAILPGLGIGGRVLFKQETTGLTRTGFHPHIRKTASILWKLYLGLTIVETLLLHLAGVNLFDALCHAFTTLATGGYSTRTASTAAFNSLSAEIVIIVFMVIAGTNFTLYASLWHAHGRWAGWKGWRLFFRDPELRLYLALLVGQTAIVAGVLATQLQLTPGVALRQASFQVASIQTSTGFATADYDAWPPVCRFILLLAMIVGASAGSTGGGSKVIRHLIAARMAGLQLRRFFRPRRVQSVRVGVAIIDAETQQAVSGFLYLFGMTWLVSTVALALLGSDLVTAMSASVACLSNIGPGFGDVGPMSNYAALPMASKLVLTGVMLIGRLELFTILGLVSRSLWRS